MAGITKHTEENAVADAFVQPTADYNIAFFTNTYLPFVGGVSNSVHLYAEHLRAAGQQVLIYAPSYSDDSGDTDEVRRVISIPNPGGTEFSLPLPGSFKPMIDFAAQEFDLVHVHHPFLLGEAGMRMARSERLPLVFTYHTQYEQYTHNVPMNERAAARALIKHAAEFCNMCDLVIAPTRGVKTLLRRRGVETPVVVLPSGIEMARYRHTHPAAVRKALGLSRDQQLVLHVGRLAKEKNLDYLFAAMTEALQRVPEAVFVVAGSGPHEEVLREFLASQPSVEERVKFLGTVVGDDLVALYTAADLFVFASTSETQGMVLVEAMAGSTPVIALDAPPLRDIIREGVNGRLVPAHTPPGVYGEIVAETLGARDVLASWSKAARTTAEHYDMPRLTAHLLQHYRWLKLIPHHRLKKETMTFGLLRNFLGALWDELTL